MNIISRRAIPRSTGGICPASGCQAGPQHPVPPHDRPGYKHRRGGQPEDRPNRLCRLVAEARSVTRNPDAVNAAEMQEGEPINNFIDDANAGIRGGGGLKAVGEVLKQLGKTKIDPAGAKHQSESKAPEADHTVQAPGQEPVAQTAIQGQAATPGLDTRPPDRQARHSKHDQGECATAVHSPAGWSGEEIVVQIKQRGDQPDPDGDGSAKIAAAARIEQPILDLAAPA